jgi:hypothetical protein
MAGAVNQSFEVLHGAAADVAVETDYFQTASVGVRSGSAGTAIPLAQVISTANGDAIPLAQEISTADMSFGMLLMLLVVSTVFAAGLYHLVRCISWVCQPRRLKVSRSPENSNEAETDVRSPYGITVERTSLLGTDDEPPLSTGRFV